MNLAARVAEAAAGGQALATANVIAGSDLDEIGLYAAPAGHLRRKGVNGAVDLFEVSGEPLAEQGASSLVPRILRL